MINNAPQWQNKQDEEQELQERKEQNLKSDIIGYIKDLRFNQHKTIREIATITGKSSRDVIAFLKESVDKEKEEENEMLMDA